MFSIRQFEVAHIIKKRNRKQSIITLSLTELSIGLNINLTSSWCAMGFVVYF